MKTKSLMIVALIALFIGMGTVANAAITINPIVSIDPRGTIGTSFIAPGGVFFVVVQASDVTGITGTALTLQYDKTMFDAVTVTSQPPAGTPGTLTVQPIIGELNRVTDVLSDSFGGFTDNRVPTAPVTDYLHVAGNDTTTVPTTCLATATVANCGQVRFSGAIINPTTGNSTLTGKKNLFRVRFQVKSGVTSGTGTFALTKTILSNAAAGYDPATSEAARTVPPLMRAVAYGTTNFTPVNASTFTAFGDTEYTLGSSVLTVDSGGNDIGTTVTIQLPMRAGWNMVALPVIPDDANLTSVFPEATIAYTWQSTYVKATVLEPGLGYWVKVPAAKTYSITGVSLKKYQQIFPAAGWYMIAGPNGTAIPTTDPANSIAIMYQYTGAYGKVTQLSAGNAYWVKVKNACTFTVVVP